MTTWRVYEAIARLEAQRVLRLRFTLVFLIGIVLGLLAGSLVF